MLYYIQQVRETLKNQKGNIMKINLGGMITIASLVDYVLWTMGKVPHSFLFWAVPLGLITAITLLDEYFDK
jgi:hypothetical protein